MLILFSEQICFSFFLLPKYSFWPKDVLTKYLFCPKKYFAQNVLIDGQNFCKEFNLFTCLFQFSQLMSHKGKGSCRLRKRRWWANFEVPWWMWEKGLSMFRRVHSDDYGGAWCPGPNLDQCYCICVMDKNPGSCTILTTSTQFGMHLNKIDLWWHFC